MKLTDLFLNRFMYKDTSQNLETKDSSFVAADSTPSVVDSIPSGGAAQDINTGNVQINGAQLEPGTIPADVLDVANWGWGQTCVFSSTDLNTVSWGAGTFKSANGTSYSISAGNTGNMAAKTYIYLSLLDSTTIYQTTTTPGNAVGLGKVLVAVAQNAAVAATYNLSEATQIVGDNILANTINATKLSVAQLSAITADIGTITAGTITGILIQTAASGQRIQISGTDNYIRVYGASNQIGAVGGSTDGTSRYLDWVTPTGTDLQMGRFLAQKTDGVEPILTLLSKGYQRCLYLRNENTNSYRTTNSIPFIDIVNIGTGSAIRISNNNPDSDGKVIEIVQAKVSTTEPIFNLTQKGITSTNFRKLLTEANTGNSIWVSNGTTPNGNLSGVAGDICFGGDSGKMYYCSTTGTTWTAM